MTSIQPSSSSRGRVAQRSSSSRTTKSYTREELSVFELMGQPVWVFDIEKKSMWWANQAAVELWDAPSLEALLKRDFARDMSPSTARRLHHCLQKFERGERISELWHFTPNGKSVLPTVTTLSGIGIEAGRMAMLVEAAESYAAEEDSTMEHSYGTTSTLEESSSSGDCQEDTVPAFVETSVITEELEDNDCGEDISLLKIAAERSQGGRVLSNEETPEPVQPSPVPSHVSTALLKNKMVGMGVPALEEPTVESVQPVQRQPHLSSLSCSSTSHPVLKNSGVCMGAPGTRIHSPGAFREAPAGASEESPVQQDPQQEDESAGVQAPVVVVAYVVEQGELDNHATTISSTNQQQAEMVYTATPMPVLLENHSAGATETSSTIGWKQATIGLVVGVALGACVPALLSSRGRR